MKKTRRRGDAGTRSKKGDVVLTRRQAGLLVSVAEAYAKVHGLTPDESLLVGAAARRVRTANGRQSTRMKSGN